MVALSHVDLLLRDIELGVHLAWSSDLSVVEFGLDLLALVRSVQRLAIGARLLVGLVSLA